MSKRDVEVLFQVVYGSRLYGTSTPKSDTDLKSIYLPTITDLLLLKKQPAFKTRVDENGVKVPDDSPMPDRGVENEHIPFQTFVRDFVAGQTYAVEMAYAILKDGPASIDYQSQCDFNRIVEMIEKFGNNEVYSMVGFAMKQTFDYVKRGERLAESEALLKIIVDLQRTLSWTIEKELRLDSVAAVTNLPFLDYIRLLSGLPIGSVVNNNRTLRTLEMGGRSYPETTSIAHLLAQIQKLIDQYGVRVNAAAKDDVDFKSLSHAVRAYQQAIEILDHGKITFPRPEAAALLEIKEGRANLDEVKALLKDLDVEVQEKMISSTQRKKTPELVADSEKWLAEALIKLYNLA